MRRSLAIACVALVLKPLLGMEPAVRLMESPVFRPADQIRDPTTSTPEFGTASISGVVLASTGSASPRPARRAIVTLAGAELPAGRSAITDDEGRFVLDRLPAGRFTLTATKPAYLPAAYGARRPGRPGVPLVATAGTRIDDVSLTLTRGAAIAGVIRDTTGLPVLNAIVSAFQLLPDATLAAPVTARADDRGAYRIFGLAAGSYVVSASRPPTVAQGDIAELTAEAIDRKLEALRARRAPTAGPAQQPQIPAETTSTYVPVFHPQSYSAADAARITVAPGGDRAGADIVLDRVRALAIDGTVSGAPAGTSLMISVSPRSGPAQASPTAAQLVTATSTTQPFRFTGVVPGRYIVAVRTPVNVRPMLWARSEIEISGADLSGLMLTLQPGLRLTGRLDFDATRLNPPADLTRLQVMLEDTAPRPSSGGGRGVAAPGPGTSTTDVRGNFMLDTVMPGTYRLTTSLPPEPGGWWLRSAMVNGRDVLDVPLQIEPDTQLAGAVLTFSDRQTVLTGSIQVPAADSPSAYTIVVFPDDRAMWLPRARRIRSVRPATDGTYEFRGLPPGAYRLAALTDVGPDDLMDPSFLAALAPASIRIDLGDGERKTQSLKIDSGR